MTTHNRDKIIALREEADKFATNELSCEGEYHPDFHTVSDERFYAIAFEDGRQAEREDCAKVCESLEESAKAARNLNMERHGYSGDPSIMMQGYRYAAEAIRARGDTK